MVRDEETLQPTTYATRLPDDLAGRQCFLLDPMLATGGSLIAAIEFLFERGAEDVTAICLLGAPEGVEAVRAAIDRVNAQVSVIEKVRQFALADEPFTIENEEMTPSLKIRRHKLIERYGDRLDALYRA